MTFVNPTHHATCPETRATSTGILGRLFGVWKQRQALRRLDDRALEDIGVTRRDAEQEANRAFWDAPDTWKR